jgi:hypothetical protein
MNACTSASAAPQSMSLFSSAVLPSSDMIAEYTNFAVAVTEAGL